MSNLVIVAIPSEDDYVHKISSEKVPHCTLLFLGDVEGKPVLKIQQFLEHAVKILELGPFGLEVDYRDTLGEDKADVLFFRKDPWCLKRIADFRAQLLKNTPIKSAYDSVTQFPEWQPHLTLGYPETPAKEDKRDYPGIRWVEFDRVALWYGDYEGPEFRLEYNYDLAEVAMGSTADAGAQFLEHFGVKGMRWGHRNGVAPSAKPVTVDSVVNAGLSSKTKIKAAGGESHPASDDAVKVAGARQKLKKSGPAALSNSELQQVATRLNLERQVKMLDAETASSGKKFVRGLLGNTSKQQGQRVFNEFATQQVDRHVLKK